MRVWFDILSKDIGAGIEWFAQLRSELEENDLPRIPLPTPEQKPLIYGPFHDEDQAKGFADRWMGQFNQFRESRGAEQESNG